MEKQRITRLKKKRAYVKFEINEENWLTMYHGAIIKFYFSNENDVLSEQKYPEKSSYKSISRRDEKEKAVRNNYPLTSV